jgi:hypothetical protein
MRFFTKKEDDFLRQNYTKIPAKRMAKMLGRAEGAARQRMKLLGIIVPPEIVEKFKQDSRYKPGRVAENKGKKWSEFMSKKGMKNSRKTQFKKGAVPPNWKPPLSERLDKDGYVLIKPADHQKFMLKHRWLWEQKKGAIPKGMNVAFKDGNKLNIKISNLFLETRKKNMKRNTVHNYPKEIALTIQMMGALTRQINKRKKHIS